MPPNQFAHVTSCTPGMPRMTSAWLVGMLKIIDVERIVTTRVDELASATASKPSRTARSDANRKTAIATLRIVSAVRRLLRRALLRTSRANFIFYSLAENVFTDVGPHPHVLAQGCPRSLMRDPQRTATPARLPRWGPRLSARCGRAWPQALITRRR